jgi:hypothetical protein
MLDDLVAFINGHAIGKELPAIDASRFQSFLRLGLSIDESK